jgi:hypothetical protein
VEWRASLLPPVITPPCHGMSPVYDEYLSHTVPTPPIHIIYSHIHTFIHTFIHLFIHSFTTSTTHNTQHQHTTTIPLLQKKEKEVNVTSKVNVTLKKKKLH